MKDKKPSVTLAVVHNIHLTREERYTLASGTSIQVVGAQVPVWHSRGITSEPAVEVFCRYVLHNSPDRDEEIDQNSWGYEFNIPQPSDKYPPRPQLSDEEWLAMSSKDIEKFNSKYPKIPTATSLLDGSEGGSKRISFNQKGRTEANGVPINVLHYVRIEPIEDLVESLF